jgi:hypothetical protein
MRSVTRVCLNCGDNPSILRPWDAANNLSADCLRHPFGADRVDEGRGTRRRMAPTLQRYLIGNIS